MSNQSRKWIKRGITGVIIILLLLGCWYLWRVSNYKSKIAGMTFQEPNLSMIQDGNYIGECDVDMIYAKVEITMKSGKIENVKLLEHRHDKGIQAEKIINNFSKEQKVDVDTVTGATNSSKVIKMAVQNALIKK